MQFSEADKMLLEPILSELPKIQKSLGCEEYFTTISNHTDMVECSKDDKDDKGMWDDSGIEKDTSMIESIGV